LSVVQRVDVDISFQHYPLEGEGIALDSQRQAVAA
jgi:hypothetical protein